MLPLSGAAIAMCLALAQASSVAEASAQQDDSATGEAISETRLAEVVSRGEPDEDLTRSPARPARVDLERLRSQRAALALDEALAELPGVHARNRHNPAQDLQIQVRGYGARSPFGVRGLRIDQAGIPATAADGQSQVGHIDLQGAARVELLRGPFAALYTNGGAFLRVDGALDGRPRRSAGIALGSHGTRRLNARLGSGNEDGAWRHEVSAQLLEGGGARRQSAYERRLAGLRSEWQIGERSRLQWQWQRQDQPDSQDPQGLTRQEFERDPRAQSPAARSFGTRKSVLQDQASLRYARDGEFLLFSAAVYGGRREVAQVLSISPLAQQQPGNGGGIVDLGRDYAGWNLRAERGFLDDRLRLSAEWRRDLLRERRLGFENFLGSQLGVQGALRRDEINRGQLDDLILRLDHDLNDDLRLSAGLRRNQVDYRSEDRYIAPGNPDDSGRYASSGWVPVLGLRQALGPGLEWHAALGRALEPPTLAELAYRRDGDGGFNAELRAARGGQAEIGLRGRSGARGDDSRLRWEATLFTIGTRDEIVVDSSGGGRTSFQNAARTRREGIELGIDWRFHPRAWLRGHANWIRAEHRQGFVACPSLPCTTPTLRVEAGQSLPGVAPRFGRLELGWQVKERVETAMEWQAQAATPASDRTRASVPGHGVLGLRASLRLDQGGLAPARLLLRIDNLLDQRYSASLIVNEGSGRHFEPAPGRGFWLGADWRW